MSGKEIHSSNHIHHLMMSGFLGRLRNLSSIFEWKQCVSSHPGVWSEDSREKMCLSLQTCEGLKISAFSHVEAIRFLLSQGFQYVLSEQFMQDVLKDYFGHQCSKGARSDNPTAQQFGYNDLTIAPQRYIALVV